MWLGFHMGYIHEGSRILNFVKGYTESDKQVTYMCGTAFVFLLPPLAPPPPTLLLSFSSPIVLLSLGLFGFYSNKELDKQNCFSSKTSKPKTMDHKTQYPMGSWGKAGRTWSWSVISNQWRDKERLGAIPSFRICLHSLALNMTQGQI
jgi:hypothetical protein